MGRGQIFLAILNNARPLWRIASSSHKSYSSRDLFKLRALCLRIAARFFDQGPFEIDGFNTCVSNVRFPIVWISAFRRLRASFSSSSSASCRLSKRLAPARRRGRAFPQPDRDGPSRLRWRRVQIPGLSRKRWRRCAARSTSTSPASPTAVAHAEYLERCHEAGQTRPTRSCCNTGRGISTACTRICTAISPSRCRSPFSSRCPARTLPAASSC